MNPVCDLCGMDGFKHRHNHASLLDCPNYRQLTGDRNQCPACGEYFKSQSAFTKHRRAGNCLTPDQMRKRGMAQIEDKKNRLWWVTRLSTEDHKHPQQALREHVAGTEIDPGYPDGQLSR